MLMKCSLVLFYAHNNALHFLSAIILLLEAIQNLNLAKAVLNVIFCSNFFVLSLI